MMKKSYSRKYDASPFFKFQNSGTITAGSSIVYDFEVSDPSSKKYLPFNLVIVDNNSNKRLLFYPNQGNNPIIIPPNTSRSFSRSTIPALSTFKITNDDSTDSISAKEVSVSCQREAVDSQSLVKGLFDMIVKPFASY